MDDTKELSGEVFASALEYLPRLIDGLTKAADHFKKNETSAGLQILHDANEGLMWFNQVVLGLPVILPQGENTADVKNNWQPYLDSLKGLLVSIEKVDAAALNQTLESEIIPFIRLIYGKISRLPKENPYAQ